MTIGYLLDDTLDRSDGVQQAMITIGEHMRGLGHGVHYLVADTARNDLENIHSIGSFYSLSFNGNSVRTPKPANRRDITQLFSEVQFDILHVQLPCSPLLAGRVIRAAPKNVRIIGTFHILPYNTIARLGTKLLGLTLRSTLRRFDHIYAVSEPALTFMESAFKVKGSVLPNPVNVNFYRRYKKEKITKKQIIYIGRFDERKGVRELVEAYSRLPEIVRTQSQLTMIGKGPLLDTVKRKSEALGLNVEFPGFVSEQQKAQCLANADIAVFPSTAGESFGIVLVEAMAARAGVVVGGNNPGYASVLHHWPETLFNPKDISEFARTLQYFLVNNSERTKIGKAQSRAVSQYDVEHIVQILLNNAYRVR